MVKTLLGAALLMAVCGIGANGIGENTNWQFPTTQDKTNKSVQLDQVEKAKGGYYDAVKPIYNNTYSTYIDKQYNCSVSASTSGNTGSNATTANTSSPIVSSAGTTSADTAANSATNGLAQNGLSGVLVAGAGYPPMGSLGNNQANSGSLSAGITASNTSSATGSVTAGAGTSTQALNSQQSNSGMLTTSVSGSTACVGPLNAQ